MMGWGSGIFDGSVDKLPSSRTMQHKPAWGYLAVREGLSECNVVGWAWGGGLSVIFD